MTYRAASISASMSQRSVRKGQTDFVALPYVENVVDADIELLDQTLRSTVNHQRIGAVIVEPTQGEGGARPFDPAYLGAIRRICTELGILVIADDIQAGVGRTGPFFSFESSPLDPDIICLSKSISGLGLPMAINLIRRELDAWEPGEFTGTFRGNNLAFATSARMLETYWSDEGLEKATAVRSLTVRAALEDISDRFGGGSFVTRGSGLLCGLDVGSTSKAADIATAAFNRRLIVETCGAGDATIKLLPPLVVTDDELVDGLARLADAVSDVSARR
jgi:diaminobutyrate-2-oxoglutarate transaminase